MNYTGDNQNIIYIYTHLSHHRCDTDVTPVVLLCFLAKFVLRISRNCYFQAYSNNAVGFGDSDILYGTEMLAIGGHLPCDVDLTDSLILNVWSLSAVTWINCVPDLTEKEQSQAELQRFKDLKLAGCLPFGHWISPEVNNNSATSRQYRTFYFSELRGGTHMKFGEYICQSLPLPMHFSGFIRCGVSKSERNEVD